MSATRINHVSINAVDMELSGAFYQEVLGFERLPTPNFGFPVYWLRLGQTQVHLFHTASTTGGNHHMGIEVDDFEGAFKELERRGALIEDGFFANMWEMPDGAVQLYFRDPADNLVEIDHPDVTTLNREVFGGRLKRLSDHFDQAPENLRATLFNERLAGLSGA
jgi:catechol 2,3-dioxygenase-like lactoylglutathione lyase family enzyme